MQLGSFWAFRSTALCHAILARDILSSEALDVPELLPDAVSTPVLLPWAAAVG